MSQTDGSSSTGQTCKMPEGDPSPATQGPVQEPLLVQNPSYHHQPDAVVHQPPPLLLPPPPPMMFAPPPVMSSSNNNTTQQTVVVNTNIDNHGNGFKRLYVDPLGVRSWSTTICSCLDDLGSCCCGCFCGACLLCRVANRMKECAFVWCCVPWGLTAMRVKVRTMGGIRGSICTDCLLTTCCPPCALCQMSRELDAMGL
ncbi:cell number regulator 9-like [Pomacea canaliculata]|uniref:cell number regulator 9-like n=1 Tax=Pomacea canaliculata TaxID=400727 RepID=UPI000D73A20E|nr:cell number regulator 9-like [Pomacea canaliculata]